MKILPTASSAAPVARRAGQTTGTTSHSVDPADRSEIGQRPSRPTPLHSLPSAPEAAPEAPLQAVAPAPPAPSGWQGVNLEVGGPAISADRCDAILEVKDPVLRNVLVTQCYTDLAREFRTCLGSDSGVNWCAWASWASKHVGITIRQEDFPWLKPTTAIGVVAAAATGPVGLVAGLAAGALVEFMSHRSANAISDGNDEIFRRTARNYARFVEAFAGDTQPDPAKLQKFLDGVGPDGPSAEGGYSLVKAGFKSYYKAKFESDPKKKQELTLLGNAQIVWDEQITAQADVVRALPWGTRGLVSRHHLTLPLPDKTLRLGQDVPLPEGGYPEHLRSVENDKLKSIFKRFEVKDTTEGSGTRDYTNIKQRMHYILNLFRSHHQHEAAFGDTYSPEQLPYIRYGMLPPGEL
ncbi:MAG: hypothetical protein KC910_12265 [Candidatus Eremiobacteraeota bacterium]|nr:hypothetical protein [Candidatus Eremiobacteraeota bacterium]